MLILEACYNLVKECRPLNIRQNIGTHLASIKKKKKKVFHALWGNVKLSHACQVKVNAGEGQAHVFISIILHNNTGRFCKGQKKKKKNRREKTYVMKGHPVTGIHIWRNVYS